jgi:hypothetical protein
MPQAASDESMANFVPASPAEARFRAAADRVARGWGQPVQGRIDRRDEGSQVALIWLSAGVQRAVAMRHENGRVTISGAAARVSANGRDGSAPTKQELRAWSDLPDENDLTMALRMAMEVVESWQPGASVGSFPQRGAAPPGRNGW